jgi:hypothetical protein
MHHERLRRAPLDRSTFAQIVEFAVTIAGTTEDALGFDLDLRQCTPSAWAAVCAGTPKEGGMTTASDSQQGGLAGRLARWWRNLRAARMRVDDLASAGPEAQNIARDVGLSTAELYALAGKRPDAADQLKQRLAALHLDEAALQRNEPIIRDLERTCSLCGAKRQCERDLAQRPDDPVWQSYCPNAHTLQALEEDQKRKG